MTLDEMADHLAARLDLASDGPPERSGRQRALRATIGWSVDLLPADTATALGRLGVFAGGLQADAAEAVGVGRQHLTMLVRSSLLVREADRFRLLETIRDYALELLADDSDRDGVRDRHAAYHLALAEQARPGMAGTSSTALIRRLRAERANLRAAMEHDEQAGAWVELLRLATALTIFWYRTGVRNEDLAWVELALDRAVRRGRPSSRPRVLRSRDLPRGAGTLGGGDGCLHGESSPVAGDGGRCLAGPRPQQPGGPHPRRGPRGGGGPDWSTRSSPCAGGWPTRRSRCGSRSTTARSWRWTSATSPPPGGASLKSASWLRAMSSRRHGSTARWPTWRSPTGGRRRRGRCSASALPSAPRARCGVPSRRAAGQPGGAGGVEWTGCRRLPSWWVRPTGRWPTPAPSRCTPTCCCGIDASGRALDEMSPDDRSARSQEGAELDLPEALDLASDWLL